MDRWDVIVVGAGPAGLMAACGAAQRGLQTLLLEKNRGAGPKILIAGGGHCNLTQATDPQGIVRAFGNQGRFLYSALAAMGPQELRDLVAAEGVPTVVDPDGKVYPQSRKARDVLHAAVAHVQRSGATLAFRETLDEIAVDGEGFRLVTARRTLSAGRVVLSTGGQSYPGLGTTGDGYRWAAALGHTVRTPRPALVPILTDVAWVKELQGIALPDAALQVVAPDDGSPAPGTKKKRPRPLAEARGALLFTHFGLSGPVSLDVSRAVSTSERGRRPLLVCDLLPSVSEAQLDAALAEAIPQAGGRQAAALLDPWLPRRLGECLLAEAGIPPDRRTAELSRAERQRLVAAVKQLTIPTSGTLGFEKAEVTTGGVALEEVDSHTMQSRLVPGLFVAGELLDLDGPIGGYNLQAAFSTGWLAGLSV